MRSASLLVGTVIALGLGLMARPLPAQYQELVRHVPESANALVLVNAKALFASPVATKNQWAANREARFSSGLTSIPPNAGKLVLAANLLVETMRPSWQAAVLEQEAPVGISRLAERLDGAPDSIGALAAVRLPDNSFLVEFGRGRIGAMSPGTRQQVSRWVNRTNSSLSPYLQQGVHFAEANAEVIMVLDLQDAFTLEGVAAALSRYESLKNASVDQQALAKVVASIQGVMLGITFRDQVYGKLKVDFGQDATSLAPVAKALILEILGDYGVSISEIESWESAVQGKQVFLEGKLTEDGLTRLGSLIELPTTALHHPSVDASNQTASSDKSADQGKAPTAASVTQQYFSAVQKLLNGLEIKKKERKTWGQLAQWCENYARKIDQLPTLNVDKEMLKYGNYVSGQLRGTAFALRGVNIQKRTAEVGASYSAATEYRSDVVNDYSDGTVYPAYGLAAAYAGYTHPSAVINSELRRQQQARTQVQVAANAQQAGSVQSVIQNIEAATTQVRQAMTDKYQIQF